MTQPAAVNGTEAVFRAFWPITDPGIAIHHLAADAIDELPVLTARAHAVLTGPGKWRIVSSCAVPGSGRVTETVLLYEAPAVEGRSPFADSTEEGAA